MRIPAFPTLAILLSASLAFGAETLTVRTKTISAPEMGERKYLELDYAGHQFSLIPPTGWRVETDASTAEIKFSSLDNSAVLIVRFSADDPNTVLANANTMRGRIVPHLTDATVFEEFPAYSGNRQGKGMELRSHITRCRLACIPLPRGYASFALTFTEREAASTQHVLGSALTSFQQRSVKKQSSQ